MFFFKELEGCCVDMPKILKNESFVVCFKETFPGIAKRLGTLKNKKSEKTGKGKRDTSLKKNGKHQLIFTLIIASKDGLIYL
jgi:hypothetical protein